MLSHIRRIDFEIQSYCNRLCSWCPNIEFKRDFKEEMNEDTYLNFLKDITENNFGKKIFQNKIMSYSNNDFNTSSPFFSFSGYSEPFSNIDLLRKRAKQAYDILPQCVEISANTNGDYLTIETLDDLYLTNISIMDYDNKGIEYWKNRFKELEILIIDINLETEIISGAHRYINSIQCHCNWSKHNKIENRGGYFNMDNIDNSLILNFDKRNFPCIEPSYYITVDHRGNVMPCCHTRYDIHKDLIMGNINDNSIIDIFYNNKLTNFRQDVIKDKNDYNEPCKNCQKFRSDLYDDFTDEYKYNGLNYMRKFDLSYKI